MKKLKINLLLLVFITILIHACGVEETEWDYQAGDNGKLVVESILTTEHKKQEVYLSFSRDDINGQPIPASGATVSVNNGQNEFTFSEVADRPGTYRLLQAAAAFPGIQYQLEVLWQGEKYTAENQMVFVFPIPKIRFNRINKDSFSLATTPGVFSANEQAMYEFNIDWSHLTNVESDRAQQVFYVFQTLDASGIFKPNTETVYFPQGSKIIVKKYGLNDDFADYLRALAMEVEWQGGILDEASSSLPTNISNGGLGYFGVCAVRVDTLIAE